MHERYYVELAKQEKLLSRKNEKSDFYNGVFDRYVNPVRRTGKNCRNSWT